MESKRQGRSTRARSGPRAGTAGRGRPAAGAAGTGRTSEAGRERRQRSQPPQGWRPRPQAKKAPREEASQGRQGRLAAQRPRRDGRRDGRKERADANETGARLRVPFAEVLTGPVLDELRETARPSAFEKAARSLAAAVLALAEDDPGGAVGPARAAKQAAPRAAAVREVLGLALYQLGDFKAARTELAAAQRISGSAELTAVLADIERATGRPEQAIELFRSTDRARMEPDTATELLIVAASAYGDLGQPAAGVALIRRHARWPAQLAEHHLRLAYAEGDLAERAGDLATAREAFSRVVRADPDFFDAAARLERL